MLRQDERLDFQMCLTQSRLEALVILQGEEGQVKLGASGNDLHIPLHLTMQQKLDLHAQCIVNHMLVRCNEDVRFRLDNEAASQTHLSILRVEGTKPVEAGTDRLDAHNTAL